MWYKLLISIVVCLLVGFIAGQFTTTSIDSWYSTLKKPSFNPPNWIFGPVWTLLYILMGVALYFTWNSKMGLIFFFIQLGLNFFWSLIFFSLHSPFFAFIEILLLIFFIIMTMIYSPRIVVYLMIPYLLWVMFATVLTFSIWRLNG